MNENVSPHYLSPEIFRPDNYCGASSGGQSGRLFNNLELCEFIQNMLTLSTTLAIVGPLSCCNVAVMNCLGSLKKNSTT